MECRHFTQLIHDVQRVIIHMLPMCDKIRFARTSRGSFNKVVLWTDRLFALALAPGVVGPDGNLVPWDGVGKHGVFTLPFYPTIPFYLGSLDAAEFDRVLDGVYARDPANAEFPLLHNTHTDDLVYRFVDAVLTEFDSCRLSEARLLRFVEHGLPRVLDWLPKARARLNYFERYAHLDPLWLAVTQRHARSVSCFSYWARSQVLPPDAPIDQDCWRALRNPNYYGTELLGFVDDYFRDHGLTCDAEPPAQTLASLLKIAQCIAAVGRFLPYESQAFWLCVRDARMTPALLKQTLDGLKLDIARADDLYGVPTHTMDYLRKQAAYPVDADPVSLAQKKALLAAHNISPLALQWFEVTFTASDFLAVVVPLLTHYAADAATRAQKCYEIEEYVFDTLPKGDMLLRPFLREPYASVLADADDWRAEAVWDMLLTLLHDRTKFRKHFGVQLSQFFGRPGWKNELDTVHVSSPYFIRKLVDAADACECEDSRAVLQRHLDVLLGKRRSERLAH